MKIEKINVFVSCPGKNFVALKIITDRGNYGLGDATVNGREMAVLVISLNNEKPWKSPCW